METLTHKITGLHSLEFLIGEWQSEGETVTDGGEDATAVRGTDTYEWTLEGQFILHTVDVMMGQERVHALELIGFDHENDRFILRSFDNAGAYTEMTATLTESDELMITSLGMRSRLTHVNNHAMTAHWERFDDTGGWQPWMDMRFEKRL